MSRLHTPVTSRDHIEGPADAPVTLVEYGDYQCPVCGEAYPAIKQLQERFGDQVRFVFRNFPIPELHPQAMTAATCAEFCGAHGKFWEAHDLLYENQDQLGAELCAEIVRRLGLSDDGLRHALETNEFGERIQADIDSGLRSGLNGTPTFYLNGEQFQIEQSFDELDDAVAQLLGE